MNKSTALRVQECKRDVLARSKYVLVLHYFTALAGTVDPYVVSTSELLNIGGRHAASQAGRGPGWLGDIVF